MISGFFLYREFELSIKNYAHIVVRRFGRIYPAYIVVTILALIGYITCMPFESSCFSEWGSAFWNDSISLKSYLLQFILIAPFDSDLLNPVVWTLRVELQLIFITPFFIFLLNRCKNKTIDILITSLSIIFSLQSHLAYLPAFVVGMVARKWSGKELLIARRFKILSFIIGVICLDLNYFITWMGYSIPSIVNRFVGAVGAALLILAVMRIKKEVPLLSVIGRNSFYIYLVHLPCFLWLRFLVERSNFILYGICSLVMIVIMVAVVKRLEQLLQKLQRKDILIFNGRE